MNIKDQLIALAELATELNRIVDNIQIRAELLRIGDL